MIKYRILHITTGEWIEHRITDREYAEDDFAPTEYLFWWIAKLKLGLLPKTFYIKNIKTNTRIIINKVELEIVAVDTKLGISVK